MKFAPVIMLGLGMEGGLAQQVALDSWLSILAHKDNGTPSNSTLLIHPTKLLSLFTLFVWKLFTSIQITKSKVPIVSWIPQTDKYLEPMVPHLRHKVWESTNEDAGCESHAFLCCDAAFTFCVRRRYPACLHLQHRQMSVDSIPLSVITCTFEFSPLLSKYIYLRNIL